VKLKLILAIVLALVIIGTLVMPVSAVSELGKRYSCSVCGTVVLCIKSGTGQLTCDGKEMEMIHPGPVPSGLLEATFNGQTIDPMVNVIGKRYRCTKCGAEFIVIKAGTGTLSCCGQPMELKK
jgi:desulfoferrodoxin-like iron-binding protein